MVARAGAELGEHVAAAAARRRRALVVAGGHVAAGLGRARPRRARRRRGGRRAPVPDARPGRHPVVAGRDRDRRRVDRPARDARRAAGAGDPGRRCSGSRCPSGCARPGSSAIAVFVALLAIGATLLASDRAVALGRADVDPDRHEAAAAQAAARRPAGTLARPARPRADARSGARWWEAVAGGAAALAVRLADAGDRARRGRPAPAPDAGPAGVLRRPAARAGPDHAGRARRRRGRPDRHAGADRRAGGARPRSPRSPTGWSPTGSRCPPAGWRTWSTAGTSAADTSACRGSRRLTHPARAGRAPSTSPRSGARRGSARTSAGRPRRCCRA